MKKEPRQFDAVCVCGVVIKGDPGLGLRSVQERFALEHLRLAPTDAAVVELTRRQ
jgi:predicted DNA-binding transcriptional regulator YafY